MAKNTINRTLEAIPLQNSSISDTLNKIGLIQNLYQLGNISKANEITAAMATFIEKEFDYILSLENCEEF